MLSDNILTLALAAASLSKILVDLIRLGIPDRPPWVSPTLAVVFGIFISLVLMVANGEALTYQVLAQSVLAGILAGGSSVGITELQRRAV